MAAGIQNAWSATASSNDSADSNINWLENQAPSTINNSARAMMAAIKKTSQDYSGKIVTGGTATAYTVTTNESFSALADGLFFRARMHATNGATPTIAVDGLTAAAIQTAAGTAVGSGVLVVGAVYSFTYNSSATAWLVSMAPAPDLAAGSVTNAKLASVATQTFKGRTTAGTGDPEDLTVTQATAMLNAVVGDSGAGGTKGLVPAPSAGDAAAFKFLKADGAFSSPRSPGDLVLLNTVTASSSSTIDDTTSLADTNYTDFLVVIDSLIPGTTNVQLQFLLQTGGSFQTTGYTSHGSGMSNNSATVNVFGSNSGAGASVPLTPATQFNTGGVGAFGTILIKNVASTSVKKPIMFDVKINGSTFSGVFVGSGYWSTGNGAITGVRLKTSSGVLASGAMKIYGIVP